jgi:maltose O-acetyltransferase
MKYLLRLVYYFNIKYIDQVKKFYYKNLFNSCGKNLRVYGNINIKSPSNISIGNNCTLNDNLYLNGWSNITIGDNVALSAHSMIISTGLNTDSFLKGEHIHTGYGITLGNNIQIGAGAIILDGISIGDNVIVGAGSVVTKNIPDNVIVAGSPAKVLRNLKGE